MYGNFSTLHQMIIVVHTSFAYAIGMAFIVNPFNTTQYVKSDGFQVLLDRHVMYAIGTASDFELMK